MGLGDFFNEKLNNGFSAVLTGIVALSTLFTILLLTLPKQYDPYEDKAIKYVDENGKEIQVKTKDGKTALRWKQGRTVQILVLGDIGRSPRMQYHALSIAKHGGRVFLIGYQESEIHPDIVSNPLIEVVPLVPAPESLRSSSKLLFPIIAPLKVLCQVYSLWKALGYRSGPARWMFVQNPPSIPTLAVAGLLCFLRNTDLVIDWHNFGYSILALKLGVSHPLVKISALYEKLFAKAAAHHITVTNAMARVLRDDYGVTAQALHDRPASLYRPISSQEKAKFLARLPETAQYAQDLLPSSKTPWRLIVSSTSWTADEDFSLLLEALSQYSAEATSKAHLPKIVAIITGKGPQKEHYLEKIRKLNQENKLINVVILTAWLTPEDYALLLASADLGVSLHTSSSGVDLPMKVVDMFGAGLPVVGWGKFEAWPELVKENVNGKGFESSQQLAEQLIDLFGESDALLKQLKEGALRESENRWDDEWDKVGGELFKLI
ncbi:chitobiosyldiphosphodolichol beta-mannosyltransferase [Parastagonospora nodorum]|nr:chitobiosyldiphosphodolichol beta-mannosyltransferase [Parastagonospora nodorum]KAH4967188.1 chitobiosyldiphosphodolichol beta-mannosyltransferase [Parastagonospora nodorum]KAH5120672.1 chitobiosyldiphosphodolichol beta-mannosyltransferase [Parastagonospora nodorum]KAH5253661.1 chitobiosyldiphosphodolichol beta-mannosyltransferase [Parastagonospora nodorum]KAH5389596.1 chitobiosyldiphosphodolichol beta-mannosyltransferase [Parastagonospora nodorum]